MSWFGWVDVALLLFCAIQLRGVLQARARMLAARKRLRAAQKRLAEQGDDKTDGNET